MAGIDEWLEQWLHGSATIWVIVLVSVAMGLRHASDPDHLTAITTLLATGGRTGSVRYAGLLGLSWGFGHATTLVCAGLPVLLFHRYLPAPAERVIEVAIGALIVTLAVRLLYHQWAQRHGHRHGHDHDHEPSHEHSHPAPRRQRRTPLTAYGIGFLHGLGGTAGLTLLLITRLPEQGEAVLALVCFALGTALSMALVSSGFSLLLGGRLLARWFDRLAVLLGVVSLAFGAVYIGGALGL
jgi:ABC-type nickel/cobalt efflux system permease component RcnA